MTESFVVAIPLAAPYRINGLELFMQVRLALDKTISPPQIRFSHAVASLKRALIAFAASAICLLSFAGCTPDRDEEIRIRQANTSETEERSDTVSKAVRYLPMLMQFERTAPMHEVLTQLNSWCYSNEKKVGPWPAPALAETISNELKSTPLGQQLNQFKFSPLACEYMMQCQLMRDNALWIIDRPYRDKLFSGWLEKKQKELDPVDASRLEQTMKLFDWTIRNIALVGAAKDVEALPNNPSLPITDFAFGYRTPPYQTLMLGRGDAYERIRVFTQMLFQLDIPSLILAIPNDSNPTNTPNQSSLNLWCIGVPISGEIYLFEPRWGLPIPTEDQLGIATLREAKSNPAILRRAKLPGRFDYPLAADDLKNVQALVDVDPFAYSKLFVYLEAALTGDARMNVALDVDGLATQLKKADPQLKVSLWELPWLSYLYSESVRSRLNDLSPFSLQYQGERGMYLNDSIIYQARMAHFHGKFENTIDQEGAAKKYMNIRIDEATLAKLNFDRDIQVELQVIRRPSETQDEFQMRVEQSRGFYRVAKLDAHAFLGMLQFDLNNLDAASNWLNQRILQIPNAERWFPQARYVLGRVMEDRGDIAKASEWYKAEGSPQEAGNRIRLRLLEKQNATDKQTATEQQ